MCGILGAVAVSGRHDPRAWSAWLDRGLGAMLHRGPDAGSHFTENGAALGARRLRVHDISPNADQPLHSADNRSVIVFNGAIFNFRSLRAELEALGHRFRTSSDTEVASAALAEWEEDAFRRFDGMFAIAWYDRTARRLLIGRDKLGIKPLYYTTAANEDFLFASEIKPLLAHPGVARRVNREAIPEFLAFQAVAPPDTLFEGIRVLEPGCFFSVDLSHLVPPRPRCYWRLDASFVAEAATRAAGVEPALETSLRRSWDADTAVGIQLSGGVDSSLVVAVSHDALERRDMETYSVVFDDAEIEYYKPRSEEAFIDRVAAKYGCRTHAFRFGADEVRRALPEAIWFHEQPLYGASTSLYMLLAKAIRRDVTVLITGEGADDIFLGYFANWRFDERPESLFRYFNGPDVLRGLLGAERASHAEAKPVGLANAPELAGLTPGQKASVVTIRTVLHGLLARHDRMFMSHSIEGRPPFCTDEMLFARFALRDDQISDGEHGKLPLKRLAERFFDRAFAFRPKIGFSAPYGDWCAKPQWWRRYVDRLDEEFLGEFVDPVVYRAWRAMPDDVTRWSGPHLNMIFALMQFQLWHDVFIASEDPLDSRSWEMQVA